MVKLTTSRENLDIWARESKIEEPLSKVKLSTREARNQYVLWHDKPKRFSLFVTRRHENVPCRFFIHSPDYPVTNVIVSARRPT